MDISRRLRNTDGEFFWVSKEQRLKSWVSSRALSPQCSRLLGIPQGREEVSRVRKGQFRDQRVLDLLRGDSEMLSIGVSRGWVLRRLLVPTLHGYHSPFPASPWHTCVMVKPRMGVAIPTSSSEHPRETNLTSRLTGSSRCSPIPLTNAVHILVSPLKSLPFSARRLLVASP